MLFGGLQKLSNEYPDTLTNSILDNFEVWERDNKGIPMIRGISFDNDGGLGIDPDTNKLYIDINTWRTSDEEIQRLMDSQKGWWWVNNASMGSTIAHEFAHHLDLQLTRMCRYPTYLLGDNYGFNYDNAQIYGEAKNYLETTKINLEGTELTLKEIGANYTCSKIFVDKALDNIVDMYKNINVSMSRDDVLNKFGTGYAKSYNDHNHKNYQGWDDKYSHIWTEIFAESTADVYANGDNASILSREVVRLGNEMKKQVLNKLNEYRRNNNE